MDRPLLWFWGGAVELGRLHAVNDSMQVKMIRNEAFFISTEDRGRRRDHTRCKSVSDVHGLVNRTVALYFRLKLTSTFSLTATGVPSLVPG